MQRTRLIKVLPFLLLPLLVYVAIEVFTIVGMFHLSFQEWKSGVFHYIGFSWYKEIFQDRYVRIATLNTVKWMSISVIWAIIVPFGIALLLNQGLKGENFFKAVFIIPQGIAYTAAGLMWATIYSPDAGILNITLEKLGLGSFARPWLGDPNVAIYCLIFAKMWIRTGFYMMVYLTGLQALPKGVLDAARVDGADPWHRLFHVIIPMMKMILVVVITLDLIESLKTFDIVFTTTMGGPGVSTEVLGTRIYKAAFQHWELGYSCAIATVLFLITMVITAVYLHILMKGKKY